MEEPLYLECTCKSVQHTLVIKKDGEDIFLYQFLIICPFLTRLKYALYYILGKDSSYGIVEEFLISDEAQKEKLKRILK